LVVASAIAAVVGAKIVAGIVGMRLVAIAGATCTSL
jgi:hypothetical protein